MATEGENLLRGRQTWKRTRPICRRIGASVRRDDELVIATIENLSLHLQSLPERLHAQMLQKDESAMSNQII